MLLFSWFNSPDQLEAIAFWIGVVGGLVELAVAIGAFIDLRSEHLPKEKEKRLERYIALMALIAAVCAFASLFLSRRSATLETREQQRDKQRSEAALANMDAITGPVRTAQAHVFFALSKPEVATNRNIGMFCAMLGLVNVASVQTNRVLIPRLSLATEQFNSREDGKVSLDFEWSPSEYGLDRVPDSLTNLTAGELMQSVDGFILDVWFLPPTAEIVRGYVAVTINSSIKKQFTIPPQKIGRWMMVTSHAELKPSD